MDAKTAAARMVGLVNELREARVRDLASSPDRYPRFSPGGVGPVTVSILMRNAVTAALAQKRFYDEAFDSKSDTLVHVAPAE